jgi:hypothetical protein
MAHTLRFSNGVRLQVLTAYEDVVEEDARHRQPAYRRVHVVCPVGDWPPMGPVGTPTEYRASHGIVEYDVTDPFRVWSSRCSRASVEFVLSGRQEQTYQSGLRRRRIDPAPFLETVYPV